MRRQRVHHSLKNRRGRIHFKFPTRFPAKIGASLKKHHPLSGQANRRMKQTEGCKEASTNHYHEIPQTLLLQINSRLWRAVSTRVGSGSALRAVSHLPDCDARGTNSIRFHVWGGVLTVGNSGDLTDDVWAAQRDAAARHSIKSDPCVRKPQTSSRLLEMEQDDAARAAAKKHHTETKASSRRRRRRWIRRTRWRRASPRFAAKTA